MPNHNRKKLKVLIVASEALPFAKTGGLADVAGALPKALLHQDPHVEVALAMPKYQCIPEGKWGLKTRLSRLAVPMGMGEVYGDVLEGSTANGRAKAWFIHNPRYFDRDQLYGTSEGDYGDNAERFAFFSKAVLEMLLKTGWIPDIIHCNDWQTGLLPLYLRRFYRDNEVLRDRFGHVRTLFTIHNLAYQGLFPKWVLPMTGIGWEDFHANGLEFYDQVNYLKSGLVYSDALSTVSDAYAHEIQTPEMGNGMNGVLSDRGDDLYGIVNGLDYEEWDPATDKDIPARYTIHTIPKKEESKKLLLTGQGLPYREGVPVFGIVSRLSDQKGLDLIAEIIEPFLSMDVRFVVLGTGDQRYHYMLEGMRSRFPDKLGVNLKFDNRLAKLIYAGSDVFVMPSRFEPCGLGQLIALKYGTVPVVRKTGGLADTIEDLSADGKTGNGFVFEEYSGSALLGTLRRAAEAYGQPKVWKALVQRGMSGDFSWDASARKYLELYRVILEKP